MKTFLIIMLPILLMLIPLLMMVPLSFASGFQLIVTTDKQIYHVGDAVHIYGNITYNDWYYSGELTAGIDITWPQNSIHAAAPVDNDGRFSCNLTNVQDTGTYNVTVNCRVAGTVVTNSTTFTVIPVDQRVAFAQSGVSSDFTGTVVTIDGTNYAASDLPISFLWCANSVHTYSFASPLDVSSGEQYVWGSTTGLSAAQSGSLTVTGSGIISGDYATQYQITFDQTGLRSDFTGTVMTIDGSDYSFPNLPLAFWWNEGSTHIFLFASPLTVNSTTQYVWESTSGLSSLQSDSFTVTASANVVGDYSVQNVITFDQSGVSSDFTGTVLVVDGTSYYVIDLPVSFYWTVGSMHNFAYESPLTVTANTKQYVWTGITGPSSLQSGSITVITYGTVVAGYKTRHYITVSSDHGTPTTSQWLDQGSSLTASVTSPTEVMASDCQWVCTGFNVDGNSLQSGTGYTFSDIDTNHTIVFTWKEQFWIQVDSSHDASIISQWVDHGNSLTISVTSPADDDGLGTRYTCTGYALDSNAPLTDGNTGHDFSDIQSNHTLVFNWIAQYRLTVTSDHDPPVPSVGYNWYDAGTQVNASVASLADESAGTRYSCTGYTGTGSVPSGSGTSVGFSISEASTLTWNWIAQYYVTFSQSGVGFDFTGTVVTVDSSSYGVSSLPVAFWWNEGSTHVFLFASPLTVNSTTQYVWESTSGLSSLQSDLLTVNVSGTVTGNHKTQYYLIVNSPLDTSTPATGWFDDGTEITASVTSPVSGSSGTRYVCTGWIGTGSAPASGVTSSVTFVISAASTITWNWKTQYYLTVTSAQGSPTPPSGWFDSGTRITENVTSPVSGSSGTRYVCTGWIGTGSVPSSGSRTTVTFRIAQASSIIWTWKTQYGLTMAKNFGTISPSVGTHWYDAGSTVNVSATAPSVQEGARFVWNGWIGSGSGSYTGQDNPAVNAVTMNGPVNETASWTHQYLLIVNTNGMPSPYSTSVIIDGINVGKASDGSPFAMWITAGTSTGTIGADTQVSGGWGTRYVFTSWGGGSTANPRSPILMNAPKTLTANYKTQYQVTFSQSGIANDFAGTVVKIDGVSYTRTDLPTSFWWNNGSSHTFQFMSPLKTSSGQYVWASTTGLSTAQAGRILVSGGGNVTASYTKK